MAVGEQAVVTDAMEAGWEDVEQEAAHELADVEAHDLAPMTAVLAIVLPAETDISRQDRANGCWRSRRDAYSARDRPRPAEDQRTAFWHRRPIRSCAAARGKLATGWRVRACRDRRRTAVRRRRAWLRDLAGTGGETGARARGLEERSRSDRRSSARRPAIVRHPARCNAHADGAGGSGPKCAGQR